MSSKLNEVFQIKEAPDGNLPNGEEGLTVKALMELLRRMPQDALVVEERQGEHRFLRKEDVSKADQIMDANDGDQREGSFVVMGAWS